MELTDVMEGISIQFLITAILELALFIYFLYSVVVFVAQTVRGGMIKGFGGFLSWCSTAYLLLTVGYYFFSIFGIDIAYLMKIEISGVYVIIWYALLMCTIIGIGEPFIVVARSKRVKRKYEPSALGRMLVIHRTIWVVSIIIYYMSSLLVSLVSSLVK